MTTELREVKNLFPAGTDVLIVPNPTKSVLPHLPRCQFVHFSCHGYTSADHPSQSRLLLEDWQTIPLTVSDLTQQQIEPPQFAYLSACHTPRAKDIKLLDKSITLSLAVHLAGYPSVVGTLWQVSDSYSPQAAKAVYDWILRGAGKELVDASRAAEVLHRAVRELQSNTRSVPIFSKKVTSDPLI